MRAVRMAVWRQQATCQRLPETQTTGSREMLSIFLADPVERGGGCHAYEQDARSHIGVIGRQRASTAGTDSTLS